MSSAPEPSRDLLFGLLAVQNGLIDRGRLLKALDSWCPDKFVPLAEHLVRRGDLTEEDRAGIDVMVALHLRKHDGDTSKCLASVPGSNSTLDCIASTLTDPDVDATLTHVGSGSTATELDPDHLEADQFGAAGSDRCRFRVLRPHAHGGLGAVFVALDTELNREVALKRILDRHADDPSSRQRFLVEAEITGGLEHPGIVPVYGMGTYADGRPYYAMRFIRGDSLRDAIGKFHQETSHADPGRRALEMSKLLRRFVDVCNAMEYAHARGVLHRDLKPGNIIVGKYGETLVVDWGLAKSLGDAGPANGGNERPLRPSSASGSVETLAGRALGTPAYMSPEQALGELDRLGPRSDVYSLGATLYALLTGKAPFSGAMEDVISAVTKGEFAAPRVHDASVPRALEAICLKAMALRPEDRYASCRALADDVERWLADEPVAAYPDPTADRVARWARHHRPAMTAAAALLVAAVVGLSIGSGLIWREQRRTEAARQVADAERVRAEAEKGRAEESKEVAEAARQHAEAETRRAESNLKLALGIATDLTRVAELNETGRASTGLAEREAVLKAVLQASETVLAARPDDPELRARTARLLRYSANFGRLLGRSAVARDAYERSVALQEALSRDDPERRDELSQTLRDQATFLMLQGRLAEADRASERAIALGEVLAEADPERHDWALAVALLDRAELLSVFGRHAEAVAASRKTRRLLDDVLTPGRRLPPHHLAPLFRMMGTLREAIARREVALASAAGSDMGDATGLFDEAVEQARALSAKDNGADVVHNLSRALAERATTAARDAESGEAAFTDLDEAIGRWEGLVKESPQVPLYREWLSRALTRRGELRIMSVRRRGPEADAARQGAEKDLAAAIARLEDLVRSDPERATYRGMLGDAWAARAEVVADEAARRLAIDRALSSFRGARNRESENPRYERRDAEVRASWPEEANLSDERRKAAAPGP
jgi:serine/threonine protein kinase/tetratricopeptide (TPR) repeat protein